MFKAISGALSLVLTLTVLRLALPDVAVVLTEVIIKALTILSSVLDVAASQTI